MSPASGTGPPVSLDAAVRALNNGDWRTVLRNRPQPGCGTGDELAVLAVALTYIGASMRWQCASGAVETAHHHLTTAERLLRSRPRLWQPDRVARPDRPAIQLAAATTGLVLRERADLEAVRTCFATLPRGRQELIHATVEYLIWVEFDPWTVLLAADDRALLGLDKPALARFPTANRQDLLQRATALRQFADARAGSVTERPWKSVGGYPWLRAAALHTLADQELDRGRSGRPVRLGRRRAWEYARRWREDLSD